MAYGGQAYGGQAYGEQPAAAHITPVTVFPPFAGLSRPAQRTALTSPTQTRGED